LIAAGSAVAIDTMPGASTKPVVAPAKNKVTALLTSVRAARHEGYDRVVYQFANTLPGYDVRYVKRPVHQDGSGKVVRPAITTADRRATRARATQPIRPRSKKSSPSCASSASDRTDCASGR
jgi:hypothetical protein